MLDAEAFAGSCRGLLAFAAIDGQTSVAHVTGAMYPSRKRAGLVMGLAGGLR